MKRTLKTAIAAVGAATLIFAGAAYAQDATTTPEAPVAGQMRGQMRGQLREAIGERFGGGFARDLVLEYTGLDEAGLREAITSGSTLSELIVANGRTVEEFTAAAMAEYDANQAERRTNFETRLAEILNGTFEGPRADGEGQGFFGRGGRGRGQQQPEVTPAPGAST